MGYSNRRYSNKRMDPQKDLLPVQGRPGPWCRWSFTQTTNLGTSRGYLNSGESLRVGDSPVVVTPILSQTGFWNLSLQGVQLCHKSRRDYDPLKHGLGTLGHCVTIHRDGDGSNPILCRKCDSGFETEAIGDVPTLRGRDRFDVLHGDICTTYLVLLVVTDQWLRTE